MHLFKNIFIASFYKVLLNENRFKSPTDNIQGLHDIMKKYSKDSKEDAKACKSELNDYLSAEIINHYKGKDDIKFASARDLVLLNDSPLFQDICQYFSVGPSFFKLKQNSHIEHAEDLVNTLIDMINVCPQKKLFIEASFNQLLMEFKRTDYISENNPSYQKFNNIEEIKEQPLYKLNFNLICQKLFTDEIMYNFINYFGNTPPLPLLNLIINVLDIESKSYPKSYALLVESYNNQDDNISNFLLKTFYASKNKNPDNISSSTYKSSFSFFDYNFLATKILNDKSIEFDFRKPNLNSNPYYQTITCSIPLPVSILEDYPVIFDNIGLLINFFDTSHSVFNNFENPFFAKINFASRKLIVVIHENSDDNRISNVIFQNPEYQSLVNEQHELDRFHLLSNKLQPQQYDKILQILTTISYALLKTVAKNIDSKSFHSVNFDANQNTDFIQQKREFYLLQEIDKINVTKNNYIKKKI